MLLVISTYVMFKQTIRFDLKKYLFLNFVIRNHRSSWYNVVSTLHNVVSRLFQRCATLFCGCFNVGVPRCINVVHGWTDVGFCFIFKVGSTLFQRWFTTWKQRRCDVEMLAGYGVNILCKQKNEIWKQWQITDKH